MSNVQEIRARLAPRLYQRPRPLAGIRGAQARWAQTPLAARLNVIRRARYAMAAAPADLAASVPTDRPGSLHRTQADTLVAEVLPLIEACRFLERESESVLEPQCPDPRSRPTWLAAVSTEIRREPYGVILIVGPANYPLLLPGVQALQALAAGNAVLCKPAPGGTAAAQALRSVLLSVGLDPMLFQVLNEEVAAVAEAVEGGVDKVFLTGSAPSGRAVLRLLTDRLIPAVLELSGCDAVFVLDDADLDRVAMAVAFGLRFNGSATCMAPRRMFIDAATLGKLLPRLTRQLAPVAPVPVPPQTRELLTACLADAVASGAELVCGGIETEGVSPMLLVNATPRMFAARSDLFAPILSIINVSDEEAAVAADDECPYALTAAIFGSEKRALALASRVEAGTVLINDLIVSTADPRAPFGGRGLSGFGVTRGREGLLEMTTIKTVQIQRSRSLRPYQPALPQHGRLFEGFIQFVHSEGLRGRLTGLIKLIRASRRVGSAPGPAAAKE